MNTTSAKNQLKQLFSDERTEENPNKKSSLENQYRILRAFCIEHEIFSFNEMETLEHECIERLDKIYTEALRRKQNSVKKAEKVILDLREAVEQKDTVKILEAYTYIEEDDSFSWSDVDEHYGDDWDELVDEANDILYS